MLAAFAKGNATNEEKSMVRQYLMNHPEEMESVLIMMDENIDLEPDGSIDEEPPYTNMMENLDNLMEELGKSEEIEVGAKITKPVTSAILPITSMAAQNTIDNLCVIHCESYILRHFGMEVDEENLLKDSTAMGWLQPEGTAIYNIGRLCGKRGLNVATYYNSNINDIKNSLDAAKMVIAVVNAEALSKEASSPLVSDSAEPNHAVLVSMVNDKSISIIDSATPELSDQYSIEHFVSAWATSSYCLIVVGNNDHDYEPHPIDLSDIALTDDLIELREAIAENAHEVWAYNRKKEGWTYGPVRDDEKKTNPDLIPYNRLPESEKLYDREMAMETIKLLDKLGWEVRKKR